ncbi:PVC-type heme-binding CxxCH protein [Dyadobacter crusticola]|uniref:PVC-type heme-binding CxxCH protein n=1 Tax=Dyadobacter crusticola TaxID=292407 RepID=UPI000AC1D897|nr:PVC-type heme-binding CxxCH protein [Dyadobacter crusticola]
MTYLRICLTFLLVASMACSADANAQALNPGFLPQKGDRIILLGNTFADRMRHYGYFETILQKHFPDKNLTLRNMGWSVDEVALQPRPLNFPGFGEKTKRLTVGEKEVTFKGFTHEGEPIVMPVGLNFKGLNQDLYDQRADIILLCFGLNEAFKGTPGIPRFEKDLLTFIKNLQANQYNGKSAPKLVLVSPIAHEDLGKHYPDPAEHNRNLLRYTESMKKIAASMGLFFVDLYTPSSKRMQEAGKSKITINGIHLTREGYQLAAEWMAQSLGFGKAIDFNSITSKQLTEVIKMKDDHFFYRWRAVNGEYIYGRRREPFGVIAFPPELRKLNQMAAALDSVIWDLARGGSKEAYQRAMEIVDRRGKPIDPMLQTAVPMTGRQGEAAKAATHEHHNKKWPATTDKFKLPEGYEINLFASEKDFPIEKPVAMNFDAKGRLWVATMPTYPQYFPGIPVHDKIVILEDTDGDGKADKHTVFADDLYLPLGFEFGNGGVFVSQEPDILFLKDTDGDDKADLREVVLTGFGSEDSHHATHAFTYGQDGALYFNEGTFLNTQVETPYGPVRSYAGATYRFEPRTGRLQHYISYPYFNPWGSIFDKWGTHLIGDASDGSNYFAPPMTGKVDYPDKHPRINMFTETRVRPTAGIEIVSSRNFPEEVQGDFLVNNNIGFQGTKQHRIVHEGSGIIGKEVEPLLQSADPNYRPIDLEFGPDGALYIVDWYNPLISHGENPPRDPARDKSHGRVWRVSYRNRPLSKVTDLTRMQIPELLESLKAPEDRLRYRTRIQLRSKEENELLPELKKWVNALDKQDTDYEHHLLEALWLYQDFDVVEEDLLKTLLHAKDPRARTAATKVLRFWHARVPGAVNLLRERINDESARVRLEAIVAASFFENEEGMSAAFDILRHPTDYYLDYAISETFRHLKPVWYAAMQLSMFLPDIEQYLLPFLSDNELLALPKNHGPTVEILGRRTVQAVKKKQVLASLARELELSETNTLLYALKQEKRPDRQQELVLQVLRGDKNQLAYSKPQFEQFIKADSNALIKQMGYAAIMTAEGSDKSIQNHIAADQENYLKSISMLQDKALQASFFAKSKTLAPDFPETTYPILMEMVLAQPAKTQSPDRFIASLKNLPVSTIDSEGFGKAVNAMKTIVNRSTLSQKQQLLRVLESLGTLEITLTAVEAKMAFDKTAFDVPAGRKVSLVFNNPDLMPHNVVITRPGTEQKVGEAADAMAQLKDGFEKNFVPVTSDVLFATPLVNSGKSFRLNFKAPEEPGTYPFICSFPGHWRVMKGMMRVTRPGE